MRRLHLAVTIAFAVSCTTVLAQMSERRLDTSAAVTFFVAEGRAASGYVSGDRDLATWALEQWSNASGGTLRFTPAAEENATIRVYWTDGRDGQYGEMRPLVVNGHAGAAVYIHPDVRSLGDDIAARAAIDPLWRDTIVYLTCVHELGHAVGLTHTSAFRDIMFSFQYGGDIVEYFTRYRRQMKARADLQHLAVPSPGDLAQLRTLYTPAR